LQSNFYSDQSVLSNRGVFILWEDPAWLARL
jgi:hypothetical protein